MTASAHIAHALFIAADQLELVSDELPSVAEPQAILLTAEKLKAEEAAREARLMEVVG